MSVEEIQATLVAAKVAAEAAKVAKEVAAKTAETTISLEIKFARMEEQLHGLAKSILELKGTIKEMSEDIKKECHLYADNTAQSHIVNLKEDLIGIYASKEVEKDVKGFKNWLIYSSLFIISSLVIIIVVLIKSKT